MGFQKAWRNNNLDGRLKARVTELLESGAVDKRRVRILVTGNSFPSLLAGCE